MNAETGQRVLIREKPSRLRAIRKKLHGSRFYYLLFALPLAYFLIFCYVPMAGIVLVFKDFNIYQGFFASKWVGLRYFNEFLSDPYFYRLLRNTLLLGVYQLLYCFPAPILFALLINEVKSEAFKKTAQTISYMPHFLSTVVVCGLIVNFTQSTGLINTALSRLGFKPVQFLMIPGMFRSVYIASSVWQELGFGSIIYLAALAGVDMNLYDASKIDGANRWQQMLHVTLPSIMPTIVVMFIFQMGAITSVSIEKILLLYNGLTYETADVLFTYVYRRGLIDNDMSYATAVGLFNSVISFLFLIAANTFCVRFSSTSLWGSAKQ